MKDRGIIFGADSVRAILAGTKTQTRRVVNPQPKSPHLGYMMMENGNALQNGPDYPDGDNDEVKAPFRVGQRLWVRETHGPCAQGDIARINDATYVCFRDGAQKYRTGEYVPWNKPVTGTYPDGWKWQSPIHMPRWASRITLEVTAVRVERLQDISEKDAKAEGGPPAHPSFDTISREYGFKDFPRSWFAQHWDIINSKKHPWNTNPWVWVIEFKKVP